MDSQDGRSREASSPGSTIDDPYLSDDEQRNLKVERSLSPAASSAVTRSSPAPLAVDGPTPPASGRGSKKPRQPKGTSRKSKLANIFDGAHDGTEDEGSVTAETQGKKSRKKAAGVDSDADSKRPGLTATNVGTRRQANGTIGSVYSGNKIRHIKKPDGEPLWRKDIQFEFLKQVFRDNTQVFTRMSDGEKGFNFADIYIDAMARSSKTSKVLKDKLQSDREAALNMAMICLLVNVGRMNTTLNFFPEMRAQLRTYHSIPSLQAKQDANAYKQLQDAPRLKSILKGASEDNEEPRTIEAIKSKSVPRTNPVNLIFVLSQYAPKISELHFAASVDFFDLVIRSTISSESRAKAFLWLMWWYLEGDFSIEQALNNPFGPGTIESGVSEENAIKVPDFQHLSEEQGALENVDTHSEQEFGGVKQKERKRILEEDEAENKLLKRVKRTYLDETGGTNSDYDSAGRSSLAARDSLGFAVLNPFADPITSRTGAQAESFEEGDWEPVNPHPGRGRYKRIKHAKPPAETTPQPYSARDAPSGPVSFSGRPLTKTSKAQFHTTAQSGEPHSPYALANGATVLPSIAPEHRAQRERERAELEHVGIPRHSLDHTRPLAPDYPHHGSIASIASGIPSAVPVKDITAPSRRTRPLTQHQIAIEQHRRQYVDYLLQRKKVAFYKKRRTKREKGNFVLRAAARIRDLPSGYDSDDTTDCRGWGLGQVLYSSAHINPQDDFGEESAMWLRTFDKAKRRLWRWEGGASRMQGETFNQSYMVHRGNVAGVEGADTQMEESPDPDPDPALDDIDKSLLAERSDEEMADESEAESEQE